VNTFYFSTFQFLLSSPEPLPLLGSTLRGGFGHIFRRMVCLTREKDCYKCILVYTCPYSYIFQTCLPPDAPLFRKTRDIPRPYVFDLGENPSSFKLILIGKSIDYLPYFLLVFDTLGKKGLGKKRVKYTLQEVKDGEGNTVYSGEKKELYSKFKIYRWEEFQTIQYPKSSILTLHLLSPLRIKEKNKLVKDLTFPLLITSLTRRLSLLSLFPCNHPIWDSVHPLLPLSEKIKVKEKELQWKEFTRYSTRQKTILKLGGLTGRIVFEGNLSPFLPLLKIGEYIHIGKGTTFGLGKYRIEISK